MYDLATLTQMPLREILVPHQRDLFTLVSELADEFHRARTSRNPATNPFLISSARRSDIYVGCYGIIGYVEENIFRQDEENRETSWSDLMQSLKRRFLSTTELPKPVKPHEHTIEYPLLIPLTLWTEIGLGEERSYIHETVGLQSDIGIGSFSLEQLTHDPSPKFPLFDRTYILTSCADEVINEDNLQIIDNNKLLVISRVLKIEEILKQKLQFAHL